MKILLVQPKNVLYDFFGGGALGRITKESYGAMPLGLPTIAALSPSDIEIEIIDENIEEIDFNKNADLVGITCNTILAKRAYEISDIFRKDGKKVVLGGIHPSFLPQESIKHADSVVIGEAENIWGEVIRDLRQKKLKEFYVNSDKPDLKFSPLPRRELLKINQYKFHTIQVGRGCCFDCDFCSVKKFTGSVYRHKTVEQVIREIKSLKKLDANKYIFFVDDNILTDRMFLRSILSALVPYNIKWFAQASINIANDIDLLKLMYASGCRQLFIGFESVSQHSLDAVNKGKVNKASEYINAINIIQSQKISIYGSFMLGGDFDEKSIFSETANFINNSGILFALINIITPPPGTRLYEKLRQEKRLLNKEWEEYTGTKVCFTPKLMTVQELEEGYLLVLQKIYSYKAFSDRLNKLRELGMFESSTKKTFKDKITRLIVKIIVTFRVLKSGDFESTLFVLRNLWHPMGTSLTSVLLGIYAHKYVSLTMQKRI